MDLDKFLYKYSLERKNKFSIKLKFREVIIGENFHKLAHVYI